MHKIFTPALSLIVLSVSALAQTPAPQSENGAFNFSLSSGWSFGLPANRAAISVPGGPSAISPEKKTLIAPSFGVGFTAWRFIVPFFDLTAYDAGKATASVGSFKSEVEGEILTINGGVRLIPGKSRVRPYVEAGGGLLHQKATVTFTTSSISASHLNGSIGNVMYGGGLQFFAGRRWGADVGFDGFHLMDATAQGAQNFSRIRFGIFFQTKSSVQ